MSYRFYECMYVGGDVEMSVVGVLWEGVLWRGCDVGGCVVERV